MRIAGVEVVLHLPGRLKTDRGVDPDAWVVIGVGMFCCGYPFRIHPDHGPILANDNEEYWT
jgi:hypothetical protein